MKQSFNGKQRWLVTGIYTKSLPLLGDEVSRGTNKNEDTNESYIRTAVRVETRIKMKVHKLQFRGIHERNITGISFKMEEEKMIDP